MNNNLKDGSLEHISEIMDQTATVEYEYHEHYYKFEYKTNLKWDEKMNILFQNLETDDLDNMDEIEESELDISGLYKDLLKTQIVDTNVDKLSLFLEKIPDEFGEKISEDIADTVGIFDESEKGNLKKL